jgi:hypothetical protein
MTLKSSWLSGSTLPQSSSTVTHSWRFVIADQLSAAVVCLHLNLIRNPCGAYTSHSARSCAFALLLLVDCGATHHQRTAEHAQEVLTGKATVCVQIPDTNLISISRVENPAPKTTQTESS